MSYLERLVVNKDSQETLLYDEHLIRYELVKSLVKDKVVLDIASGSGYGAAILAQAGAKTVIGIDIDAEAVAQAEKDYGSEQLTFKIGKAEAIELADQSIEVITSFETIEHIQVYENYLKELARVLKTEGVAFISTPNRDVFGQKNPFHIKEFSKAEFETALKEHFSFVNILEQKNGLASVIKGTGSEDIVLQDNDSQPLYFIAICSQSAISTPFKTVASVNTMALKRWENNKGWRLLNWIYRCGQKLRILK
jgi:ubiquinone/menaquinone biosynthesis C-methylase UbiE